MTNQNNDREEFETLLRNNRPNWDEINSFGGYIQCSCGQVLQSVQETRKHWENGCFDTKNSTDLLLSWIETHTQKKVEEAYNKGYKDGSDWQMDMRVKDLKEKQNDR